MKSRSAAGTAQGGTTIPDRRGEFPSLLRMHNGFPLAYLDGPAGTQVPQPVIDAMTRYYTTSNANTHGRFSTSAETDRLLAETRERRRSSSVRPVAMHLLRREYDHAELRPCEGNRPASPRRGRNTHHPAGSRGQSGPVARPPGKGRLVTEIAVRADATLDYDDFARKVGARTRLVAMGLASNAFGTVNDVAFARALTQKAGAMLLVDAVHYAPHFPVDASGMGVDFLLCSAYKFYGPHVGLLYAREGLLGSLETDRLRTQDQRAPYRIETGTQNHAALPG